MSVSDKKVSKIGASLMRTAGFFVIFVPVSFFG